MMINKMSIFILFIIVITVSGCTSNNIYSDRPQYLSQFSVQDDGSYFVVKFGFFGDNKESVIKKSGMAIIQIIDDKNGPIYYKGIEFTEKDYKIYRNTITGEILNLVEIKIPKSELSSLESYRATAKLKTDGFDVMETEFIILSDTIKENINRESSIIELGETQSRGNINLTLQKVVFNKDKTIAYIKIFNGNKNNINFYYTSSMAFQGNNQFKPKYFYDTDLPDIDSEIYSNIEDNGVVIFEPLNYEKGNVKFHFEAGYYDYYYYNYKFDFNLTIQ